MHSSLFAMEDVRSLKWASRLLYLAGQKPHSNDMYSKVNTCVLIFSIAIIWSLILIKMLTNLNNIDVLVSTFESTMTVYQVKDSKYLYAPTSTFYSRY